MLTKIEAKYRSVLWVLNDVENAMFCVFVDFEITGSQKVIGSIPIFSTTKNKLN
jgi:hypothetical protein